MWTILVFVLPLLAACKDSAAPRTGSLEFYASFTSASRVAEDTDGFVITLDARTSRRLTAFADTFHDLVVGEHILTISDVRSTCTVFGPTTKSVMVMPDTLVQAGFGGSCQ